jgi:outer membrane protein assembly factor BamB
VGETVFVGSCDGLLQSIDRQTGQVGWTYNAALDGGKPEFHGRPLITPDLIVVASDDRRPDGVGHVYAFDRSNLRLRWKRRLGAGVMTDAVHGGDGIFVVTLDDELTALDLQTGAVRWTFPGGASNTKFPPVSTPAVVEDRVFFGALDGTVYALNATSGKVLWRRKVGERISTSVAAVGQDAYVGVADGTVHRFTIVPVGDSLVLFVGEAGVVTLLSLHADLSSVRWSRNAPGSGWSSFSRPHVWKGAVFVGTEDGRFLALRLADGEPEWEGAVKGAIAGIGGDDKFLCLGTTNGSLYAYPLPTPTR